MNLVEKHRRPRDRPSFLCRWAHDAVLGGTASVAARLAHRWKARPLANRDQPDGGVGWRAAHGGGHALCAAFILAMQAGAEFRRFGALQYVMDTVAIGFTRELGPLLTALS